MPDPIQGLSQEMIKGTLNLLIAVPGRGLGSSHNAIRWNLTIFFYVQAENRPSKRRLDGSLEKSLVWGSELDCYELGDTPHFRKNAMGRGISSIRH